MQDKVKNIKSQPDYEFLLKLEKWSKKDAALIVCGFNPIDYRKVRFGGKDIPSELEVAYKIYQIFCSVDFWIKYQDYKEHPLNYIRECHEKDIAIVEPLREAVKKRLEYIETLKEKAKATTQAQETNKEIVYVDSGEGARERRYLLKMIGALAKLYFDNKKQKPSDSKQAISHLVEDTLQYLENNQLYSPGLAKSNLHKKISEGIALLLEEQE